MNFGLPILASNYLFRSFLAGICAGVALLYAIIELLVIQALARFSTFSAGLGAEGMYLCSQGTLTTAKVRTGAAERYAILEGIEMLFLGMFSAFFLAVGKSVFADLLALRTGRRATACLASCLGRSFATISGESRHKSHERKQAHYRYKCT